MRKYGDVDEGNNNGKKKTSIIDLFNKLGLSVDAKERYFFARMKTPKGIGKMTAKK